MTETEKVIKDKLIEQASKANPFITYQALSEACSLHLDMHSINDRIKIGEMLDNISRSEYKKNRVLLSALVIKAHDKEMLPGKGFFELYGELYDRSVSDKAKKDVHSIELGKVLSLYKK